MTRASAQGFAVEVVRRPGNGDWTSAVLEAMARPGAAPVSLASISSVHWADGGVIDIAAIAPALRARGAALLVDATHGAGVTPLNMAELDPDFLIFPTYKWVLGPYGRAFMYIAKRRQEGVPLEQTGFGRRAIASEVAPYMKDTAFAPTARRFDMGERDHFISLEMAAVGMEMMAEWGPGAISERLGALTDRLAEGLAAQGAGLTEKLAARKAFETGEAALTPAKTRAAIRDNFQRLSVAMGGDKKAMADLRDIADIFDRIDASMGYMRGSPTAPLIMSDKVVGTLMNVLRHPVAAAEQAGVMAMKRNLTNAIMNPEARNILIGIGKAKPNVTAAALNGMAAKLTTILARDNALDEEPTE
jgi:hypothetical protein